MSHSVLARVAGTRAVCRHGLQGSWSMCRVGMTGACRHKLWGSWSTDRKQGLQGCVAYSPPALSIFIYLLC